MVRSRSSGSGSQQEIPVTVVQAIPNPGEKIVTGEFAPDPPRKNLPFEGEIPRLPNAYQSIVTSTFTIPEPAELYAQIEAGIKPIKASKLSSGELLDKLDEAQEIARLAKQLYVNTKATVEAVELDTNVIVAAMRDSATTALEREKEAGIRKKTITEADVLGAVQTRYPDEWKTVQERLSRSKLTVSYIENLCERAAERARDLRIIVGNSRSV